MDLDYKINYNAIDTSEGNDLVSTLASFNDALTDSYNNLDPNFLVKYLFTLRFVDLNFAIDINFNDDNLKDNFMCSK
mgnify:CR=1 FL=1